MWGAWTPATRRTIRKRPSRSSIAERFCATASPGYPRGIARSSTSSTTTKNRCKRPRPSSACPAIPSKPACSTRAKSSRNCSKRKASWARWRSTRVCGPSVLHIQNEELLAHQRASLRSIEFGTLDGDGSELVGGNHVHAPALEPNPTALGPRPQLFVGALARYADHLTDLALRDVCFASSRRTVFGLRKLEQGLRQASRQIKKCDVLHLLAGPTQPRAQNLDELEHHVGVTAEKRNEVAPPDDDELAVGHGGGVGGARTAVEQGDLAENLALVKEIKHDVFALGGRDADLDGPGEHPHEPGAGVAFREDGGSAHHLPRLHVRAEVLDHRRGKIAKQRMVAQQGQLVPRALRRPPAAWNRHERSPVTSEYCNSTCALEHARDKRLVGGLDSSRDIIAYGYRSGARVRLSGHTPQ